MRRLKKPPSNASREHESATYWWRTETRHLSFDPVTHTLRAKSSRGKLWKTKRERQAHAYELARRAEPGDDFPSYNTREGRKLARLLGSQLTVLDPDVTLTHRPRSIPIEQEPDIWDPENWGTIDVDWHFIASVEAAKSAFGKLYEKEQRRRHITRRGGPHGQQTRDPSWRWPELIDEARSGVPPKHNSRERSKLAEARKTAKLYRAMLLDALGVS